MRNQQQKIEEAAIQNRLRVLKMISVAATRSLVDNFGSRRTPEVPLEPLGDYFKVLFLTSFSPPRSFEHIVSC